MERGRLQKKVVVECTKYGAMKGLAKNGIYGERYKTSSSTDDVMMMKREVLWCFTVSHIIYESQRKVHKEKLFDRPTFPALQFNFHASMLPTTIVTNFTKFKIFGTILKEKELNASCQHILYQ